MIKRSTCAMKTENTLISQILAAAQAAGLSQKVLADRSGIQEETISRIKKRGSGNFGLIVKLAQAAGAPLCLASESTPAPAIPAKTFRDKYGVMLAWSNKNASDNVLIRRALVKPGFRLLLDAAVEFGVDRLVGEWARLKTEATEEAAKAAPVTERILRHIENGYQQATR